MSGHWTEFAVLLLRWLHVVAAIAWIGESFYFVMLDRALKPPRQGAPGVFGELWSVHGGGFYHKQKYLVAPATMPDDLHWSKWKSYTTWLSGFALLFVLYLLSPKIYLIDPAVAQMSPVAGVHAAIGLLIATWVVYDVLCRVVGFRDRLLGVLVGLMVLALCYVATHLFAGRAAFLLVGASLATVMSANVFFVIIPGQKRMVAAMARGESPDPLHGKRGKQRSVHNTYFTLPVVFAMLSTHYATASAHPWSWLILAGFMAAGALIRQFFVLWHSGGRAWSLLAVGGAILIALAWWLTPMAPRVAPTSTTPAPTASTTTPTTPSTNVDTSPDPVLAAALAAPVPSTDTVHGILARRCATCHATHPQLMPSAPLGAIFETDQQLDTYAARIHQQAVVLRVMPPGNLTGITDEERAAIDRWFANR